MDQIVHNLHRRLADLADRRGDSGEIGRDHAGEQDVVTADDAAVVRHAGSAALGGTYGPVGNVPMRFGAGGDSGTTAFFTGQVATAQITVK